MGLCPADGHCTVKSGFDGFPEIEQWNARFNRLLEHQRGPSVDRLRAWLEAVNWIHDHMHGMGGIDTSTLEHCGRIPMFYTGNERWLPHEVPSTPIAAGGAAERRTVAISPDGAGEGAGRSA
jgi:hypothetical protein